MQLTVAGLPAHPLLVHAVVVLIPLAALGALAVAVRPRWNRAYAPLVAFGAVAAAGVATLAKAAGEQLEAALRIPPEMLAQINEHGMYGFYTVIASWIFAALALATAVLGRGRNQGGLPRATGALSAVSGLVALVAVVLAGHSGSASVWGYLIGR
jgi:hypothetical protein